MTKGESWDVIVAGGGPAGSATAILCAMQGRRVLLLEKGRFPRYHIGESLMPATWWSLQRLGITSQMKASPFPRKHSVQFYLQSGQPTAPFYFSSVEPEESAVTWQVDRALFDTMLLDHAKAKGVAVRQNEGVTEVLFEDGRAIGVATADVSGSRQRHLARVVVDATGQNSVIAGSQRLRQWDLKLRHAAVFTRFRGAVKDKGIDAGATLILNTAGDASWFWFIPLPDDIVSVGVVGPIDYLLKGRTEDPQRIFNEEAAKCPALRPRLATAQQEGPMRVQRDFSYVSSRIAGHGWILVGDAFGFLDPIYSSGLFLALKGAEVTADSIEAAFAEDDFSARSLGRHGPAFIEGMEALRRLVYAFYTPQFHFKSFLERFPECRAGLINLLVGNVFRAPYDGLFASMNTMLHTPGYVPLTLSAEPE